MAIHKWKKPPDAGERRRQKMEKWRQEKFLNQGRLRSRGQSGTGSNEPDHAFVLGGGCQGSYAEP